MNNIRKIAVASGKGGTGKTTVATSFAAALARHISLAPLFLDCDVEAPNAHFFLNPVWQAQQSASLLIPEIDADKCTHCGLCAQTCRFKALAVLGENVLVFPQLCHGCGACSLVCPEDAISEKEYPIGKLEQGNGTDGILIGQGMLNIGEPMAKPVIAQLKKWALPGKDQITILDAPPGTTCSVVETIQHSDFLILVTEPTPFGHHDLELMLELAGTMGIPHGVIINRCEDQSKLIEQLCARFQTPILFTIPFQRSIAEGVSQGKLLIDILPDYEEKFLSLYHAIEVELSGGKSVLENLVGPSIHERGDRDSETA